MGKQQSRVRQKRVERVGEKIHVRGQRGDQPIEIELETIGGRLDGDGSVGRSHEGAAVGVVVIERYGIVRVKQIGDVHANEPHPWLKRRPTILKIRRSAQIGNVGIGRIDCQANIIISLGKGKAAAHVGA